MRNGRSATPSIVDRALSAHLTGASIDRTFWNALRSTLSGFISVWLGEPRTIWRRLTETILARLGGMR
jgi:hypothetical protein